MKNFRYSFWSYRATTILLALTLVFVSVRDISVFAAYLVLRPITNGVINQTYLYAESSGTATHKGIDIPTATGTAVIAAESGIVMEVVESWPNDDHSDPVGFGNFVLIRYGTHYLRQENGQTVGQTGFVYFLYAHLSRNTVIPIVGDSVVPGQQIAQSDNTGNSTGPHLHFQVVLHTDPYWTVSTGSSSLKSRNPELWLKAYNDGIVQTATAIGKVTNSSGNPVGGLRICGLQKPAPANYFNTFQWVQTYSYTWANPDDILVENFGTTDVTPGTRHLYARYADGTQACNGTLYKDLGNHTFTAGQTTYIGLYPVYLPDVKANNNGWNSSVVIRNNSSSDTAQVVTTFFWLDNWVYQQRMDYLAPRSTITFSPTGTFSGSAMVVASQDVSVVVTNQRSPALYTRGAYAGIAANKISSTFYVPLLLHQRTTASGQGNAEIMVQNAVASSTTVTMQFYDGSGNLSYSRNVNLAPNASDRYGLDNLPAEWYGSAVVSASGGGQLAVVFNVTGWSGVTLQTFNAFPANSPGLQWFMPSFLSRRTTLTGNVSTPINVQNVSGATISAGGVVLNCLAAPGSGFSNLTVSNPQALSNNTAYSFNPVVDTTNFPAEWYGSCRVAASNNVVVLAQIRYPGNYNPSTYYYLAAGYEAIRAGGTNRQAFFPVIQKRLSDGSATSVVVQNLNTSSAAQVTFYYKASPSCAGCGDVTVGPYTIPAGDSISHNHRLTGPGSGTGQHNLPDGWFGSLMVVSSNQPIDGFGQLTNIYNTSGDTIMAHNATTRP